MATIELQQVEKKFGDLHAVKPMDLTINDGEFVVSGLVASSLIGVIYIAPLSLIIYLFKRVKVHPRTLRVGLMIWGLSIGGIVAAEITRWSALMMFFTVVFVLVTMFLATLSSLKYVVRYIKY